MNERNKAFQERLENFVVSVIGLSSKLPRNQANYQIFSQLIDSAASIGANYQEGCEAESSKDFVHKLMISKKENRETSYWLRILIRINPTHADKIETYLKESEELTKIFSSIISKFKS